MSKYLEVGSEADMWHQGTKSFYRVTVIKEVTPEEAMGPDFYEDELVINEGLNPSGPKYL